MIIPLSQLLPEGRPPGWPVALRFGHEIRFADLARDVGVVTTRIAAESPRAALLAAEDSYWFLVGMLALFQAGARIVLPPNGQPGTLAAMAGTVDLVVSDAGFGRQAVPLLRAPCGETPTPLVPLPGDACALEFFTSGSTGDRKRVTRTLHEIETEVEVLETLWGEPLAGASVHGSVSHQHIFGLTFRVLWPLTAGRPFAAESHLAWEALLGPLPERAVLVVSPAHLSRLSGLAPLPAPRRPLAVFTAGAPLGHAAAREAQAILGVLPTEIFGSTETGAIAWRAQAQPGTAWTPLPGMEIAVAADATMRLRSPFMAPGAEFQSADRIALGDGGFHFLGRADRVAKIEGKRVGLAEVEQHLAALPQVAEAAVLVLDGARETLAAVVAPTAEGWSELESAGSFGFGRLLRAELLGMLDPASVPKRWRFVERLPVDAMGKSETAALRRLFAVDGVAP